MRRETLYEIWIPPNGVWSLWARPVLFAQMPESEAEPAPGADPGRRSWPATDLSWAPDPRDNVPLVIDLPGEQSVYAGLDLAGRGYRPVPAYNVCTGPQEAVDQRPILRALGEGAPYLRSLNLPADAPPAFLLDANRMTPAVGLLPGVFDNRWQVFPQDFPSARFLLGRGVTRVILVQRTSRVPRDDLAHVLRRWQDAGLAVWAKDLLDDAPPVAIRVTRPQSALCAISSNMKSRFFAGFQGLAAFWAGLPNPPKGPLLLGPLIFSAVFGVRV